MVKSVCDFIIMIVSIMMEVEIFRNLIMVRNNKYDADKVKMNLTKARVLIVVIIILYSIYGIVRNII